MNLNQLTTILRSPALITEQDVLMLKELCNKYPFSQLFSILYLKALHTSKDVYFDAAKNRLTIQTSYTIYINQPKVEEMTLTSSRFADFPSSTDINSVEKELINDINKQTVQDVINRRVS